MAEPTLAGVTERWLALEDELALFEARIAGLRFWERVRFPWHMRLLRTLGVYAPPSPSRWHTVRAWLNRLRYAATSNPWRADPADILIIGTPRRKRGPDGTWWDIYADPVIDRLTADTCYLEPTADRGHRRPAHTRNLHYEERLTLAASLAARRRPVSLTRDERRTVHQLEDALRDAYGVRWSLAAELARRLALERASTHVLRRWLAHLSPQLVLIVCSYGKEPLIAACQALRIPTAELQHGTMHRYHLGYAFPGARKQTFPDHFLAFGDYWPDTVPLPLDDDHIHRAGYPYFELEAARYRDLPRGEAVLFVSQANIGADLSRLAADLATNHGVNITYKLHPTETTGWRTSYPWLTTSPITVIAGDTPPLYRLFATARAQVGVFSTALYEGLGFGLPTYLLETSGIEYMADLIASGGAQPVTDADDLATALLTPTITPPPIDRFFRRGAPERVPQLIERLLASNAA